MCKGSVIVNHMHHSHHTLEPTQQRAALSYLLRYNDHSLIHQLLWSSTMTIARSYIQLLMVRMMMMISSKLTTLQILWIRRGIHSRLGSLWSGLYERSSWCNLKCRSDKGCSSRSCVDLLLRLKPYSSWDNISNNTTAA